MNLLIDGSSLLHRAYHIGRKRQMITSYDRDVSDIMIFLNTLRSYAKQFNPKCIYIAWDKKLNYPCTNFRMSDEKVEYKAGRDKALARDVYANEDTLCEATQALGVKNMYPWIMEADDVIGWLSENLDGPNMIITMDKDMLQLVSDKTSFYHPSKKIVIDKNTFKQEVGVDLDAFLYYKAILGDPSDNINGVKGYGKVRAKQLAEDMSSDPRAMNILKEDQQKLLENNIRLMDLSRGYVIAGREEVESYEAQLEASNEISPDIDKFISICEELEFKQFMAKKEEWRELFGESRLYSILNSMFTGK